MSIDQLAEIAQAMVAAGKGIIAIDESNATIKKRFDGVGIECTEENRRAYRELLLTTPNLNEYISGAILFDETLRQTTKDGVPFTKLMMDNGIIPGIKVDKGPQPLAGFPGEVVTEGLDGLRDRLKEYCAARRALRQVARGHQHRRGHPVRHLHRSQQPRPRALRRAVPGSGHRADGRAGSDHGRRPRHRRPATKSPKSCCVRCSTRCTTRT